MNFFTHRYKKLGHVFDFDELELKKAIRVNTLKIDQKELIKRLRQKGMELKRIPFLKNGYYIDADFSPGATPEYLLGYYYIQEAASQAVGEVLNPKKGEHVLDMCAAPGSKTTHFSQLMENKGVLVALDSNLSRMDALKNNIERMGCENVIIYRKDAEFADDLEVEFDKISLDAPCSGNFMIEEDWFEKRNLDDIQALAKKQKKMIATAIEILKKGGILVYSTCSLEPEENEEVIEYALKNFNVELLPTNLTVGSPGITEKTKLCRRFWPDETGTQGFFIAKLVKK